jgi:hypothetical protein
MKEINEEDENEDEEMKSSRVVISDFKINIDKL